MIDAKIADGEELPQWFVERPELSPCLQPFLDAFLTLHGHRSMHMNGSNPVSLHDINAYFNIYNICDTVDREEYIYFIGRLDSAFLRREAQKNEAERQRQMKKAGHK